MSLCEYGCGLEAKYQLKNEKWCCSKHWYSCPTQRKEASTRLKKAWEDPNSIYNSNLCKEKISNTMKKIWKDPNSKLNSDSCREKQSNGIKKAHQDPNAIFNSISFRENRKKIMKKAWEDPESKFNSSLWRKKHRLTIERINKKYPFFSKLEEIRYNPDKLEEKEIQVRCINHNCKNSKEKDGWFTISYIQLYERIRRLEAKEGNGGSHFYCSQHCKDTCPIYNLRSDPYKNNNKPHTFVELNEAKGRAWKRDNGLCQDCGKSGTDVHHIKPVKLEPFLALDIDNLITLCEDCHKKYHKQGLINSTGNLANITCNPESQKFLEQKLGK